MRTRRLHPWMLLVVVCAASPLALNVVLTGIVSHVAVPLGHALSRAEAFTDHDTYAAAHRVLMGLALVPVMALLLGVPLAFARPRALLPRFLLFALGVLAASAVFHVAYSGSLEGWVAQWLAPEAWLGLAGAGAVAASIVRAPRDRRSRQGMNGP